MHYWLYLLAAIVLEVAGTTSMKLSAGFSKLIPAVLIFVFYGLSFGVLTLALKRIEIGVAYAIWSGLGTALIALIGIVFFREALTPWKIASLLLIIMGVVELQLNHDQS